MTDLTDFILLLTTFGCFFFYILKVRNAGFKGVGLSFRLNAFNLMAFSKKLPFYMGNRKTSLGIMVLKA